MGHEACVNFGKQRVACGVSWLLRVINHEAVSSSAGSIFFLKFGSQVSSVVETKDWTADTQPVALPANF